MSSRVFTEDGGVLYHKSKGREILRVSGSARPDGYHVVRDGAKYKYRHRVIWEMKNGEIPDGFVIDHINGIPGDDRIENLQLVTRSENQSSGTYTLLRNNTSGVNGVRWCRHQGAWVATFQYKKIRYHVGYFDSQEGARLSLELKRKEVGAPDCRRRSKNEN